MCESNYQKQNKDQTRLITKPTVTGGHFFFSSQLFITKIEDMRKIVIGTSQLEEVTRRLNEFQDKPTLAIVPDEGDERSAAGVYRTIQKNKQDIDRTTQAIGGDVNIKVVGDNSDLTSVNAAVPENGSFTQAADNLSQDQGAERLLSQGASTMFTSENKTYTKKQLEEMSTKKTVKEKVPMIRDLILISWLSLPVSWQFS